MRGSPPSPFVRSLTTSLFGWRSTNFVESDNNTILVSGLRASTPLGMLQSAMEDSMRAIYKRNERIQKWVQCENKLTPYAQELWTEEKKQCGQYQIESSSGSVFFVKRKGAATSRRIDMHDMKCTCSTSDQMQIPCRHLMAVVRHLKKPELALPAFHDSYLVATYRKAFEGKAVELVLEEKLSRDESVLHSPFYKRSGRPQKRRIRSNGESAGGNTYACKACGKRMGHNRSTCTIHATNTGMPLITVGRTILPDVSRYQDERLSVSFLLA